ncbi:hypothetical protein D3C75_730030 [compost metagenome]
MADIGQHGEQHAGEQGGEDDCPWHIAAGIAAFFGQGRDSVKAEERQAQHRRTSHQRAEARLRTVAQQWRKQVERLAGQGLAGQGDEHHDEDDLCADDQVAGLGHRVNADHVEQRDQGNRGQRDRPCGDGWKGDVQEQADQQVVDHRQEQVVEQQRPAGQEAHVRAEGHVGVGVRRARDREALDHEAVGGGGEQHGHQGDDIGAGRATTSKFGDDAVSSEDGQRDHVHQAEEHQGGQAEDTAELDGGGAGWVGHRSIQSIFVVVLWSIFIHLGGV